MIDAKVQYSVIVPVFNAENSLRILTQKLQEFFLDERNYEIIFVDDYSEDNSWEILLELAKSAKNITIVRLAKNFGQHGATLCGMKYAKGDFAITLDDDLEIHPKEIQKLIAKQKESNSAIVYGEFKKKNSSFLRNMLTSIYKLGSKIEGPDQGKGSSFRMVNKSIYRKLTARHHSFVFIDELILWYTKDVSFVNVEFNNDYIPRKRYKIGSLVGLTSNVIMFSSGFPLRLVTYLGISLASINFIIGLFYIIKKVFFKIEFPGFTAIIVSVLFSSGLIIFSIGIIAQYLRNILKGMNNAPGFNEAEVYQHVND